MNPYDSSVHVIVHLLKGLGFTDEEIVDLSIENGMNLIWLDNQMHRDTDDA